MELSLGYKKFEGEMEIKDAEDAASALREHRNLSKEVMVVFHLNSELFLVGIERAAIGTKNVCSFDTADIFRLAIVQNSDAIVIAHNHPNVKVVRPSKDDLKVTRRLYNIGREARMPLLDHIVLGKNGWYSIRESGNIFPSRPEYAPPASRASKSKMESLRAISKIRTGFVIRS